MQALAPHCVETQRIAYSGYLALHIAEANHQTHRYVDSERPYKCCQYKGMPQPWRLDRLTSSESM
jgi:hypothetical protein